MERRKFTQSALALGAGASPISRLLVLNAARIEAPLAVQAALRLLPAGAFIVWSGQAQAAFFLPVAVAGFMGWVLGWSSKRTDDVAQSENWMGATSTENDPFAAPMVLRPPARFAEARGVQGAQVKIDTQASNGKVEVTSALNAGDRRITKDVNGLEAEALKDTPWVVPISPRIEPIGADRKRFEEAFATMGASLGTKDGAYVRLFASPSGQTVAKVTNGTKGGKEFLTVIPGGSVR